MRGLPLALVLSVALWVLIVELAAVLTTLADGFPVAPEVAEFAAAAPAFMSAVMP